MVSEEVIRATLESEELSLDSKVEVISKWLDDLSGEIYHDGYTDGYSNGFDRGYYSVIDLE